MRAKRFQALLTCLLMVTVLAPAAPARAQDAKPHALANHMNQWLVGSREWTTPNPGHDADNPLSFAEFRVRWDWGPFRQQLLGKLFGVRGDGSTVLFWNMYTSYDPGRGTVIFQQIGANGAYIHGEHPVRSEPLQFGEIERLDTTMSAPDGSTKTTRHENTFQADGTHHANVFEQGTDGEWTLANQWDWRLVGEADVLGTEF